MKRHVTARHIRNGRSLSTRDNDLNKMPTIRDNVELREAQRDYLDFLDDEVREALCREVLDRGAPRDADRPREAMRDAAPRRAATRPGEVEARQACRLPRQRWPAQEPSISVLCIFSRWSQSVVGFL